MYHIVQSLNNWSRSDFRCLCVLSYYHLAQPVIQQTRGVTVSAEYLFFILFFCYSVEFANCFEAIICDFTNKAFGFGHIPIQYVI